MVTEPKTVALPTHDAYPPPKNADVRGTAEAFISKLAEVMKSGDGVAFADLFIKEGYWRDVLAFTRDFRTIDSAALSATASVSP